VLTGSSFTLESLFVRRNHSGRQTDTHDPRTLHLVAY
jgi:hypothetical protein